MEQSPNTHTWPGAFGAFKPSREAVRNNLGTLIWLTLIIIIVATLPDSLRSQNHHVVWPGWPWLLAEIIIWLVNSWLQAAQIITYLSGAKGQKIGLSAATDAARPVFLKLAVMNLLTGILLAVSFLLLIVPFFFVLPRLQLAPYFLINQKLGIIDAIKASWHDTKGHSGEVWGIIGATFLMFLPVLTIIGIPFTIYLVFMYQNAPALLYNHIREAA